jgi:signal transduction histidine kinase
MPAARREALIRIVREAVSNAGRHGRAGRVDVELGANGGTACRLRIVDDGTGFDPGLVEPGRGFGLVSMRERAEALGGRFRLVSSPGAGTEIEVVLP